MSDHYILEDKKPVPCEDLITWAKWLEKADRVVKKDNVYQKDGKVMVSTVFLGLDHSFGQGPPLLFETLVFEGSLDGEMDRYSTWAEAEKGHEIMLQKVVRHSEYVNLNLKEM